MCKRSVPQVHSREWEEGSGTFPHPHSSLSEWDHFSCHETGALHRVWQWSCPFERSCWNADERRSMIRAVIHTMKPSVLRNWNLQISLRCQVHCVSPDVFNVRVQTLLLFQELKLPHSCFLSRNIVTEAPRLISDKWMCCLEFYLVYSEKMYSNIIPIHTR